MMTTPAVRHDHERWMREGTALFDAAVSGISDRSFDEPSLLPGWTRRHLVAHVAANADALMNLVRWAATGVPTLMYASPEEREAGIQRGTELSASALATWMRSSADALADAMRGLDEQQWRREVVTAQRRVVPAAEIVWMRAREVCVHAVDLGVGVTFADLEPNFVAALRREIAQRRGMNEAELPASVRAASAADVAAWLAGRPHEIQDAPMLPPWL